MVYDFWTYSCVNCVRTLPYLRAWHKRYRQDGLVIVGVHSPEFDFEKDHGNVESAVARLKVTWPVALDDEMAIWGDFNNRYWPAKWITDRQGHAPLLPPRRGQEAATENVIRSLPRARRRSPGRARRRPPRRRSGPFPDEVAGDVSRRRPTSAPSGAAWRRTGQRAYNAQQQQLHALQALRRHLAGRGAADPVGVPRGLPLARVPRPGGQSRHGHRECPAAPPSR